MKLVIVSLFAFLSSGIVLADEPPAPPEGYGSCYEAKPICISGQPQCVCTVTQQCFWACR